MKKPKKRYCSNCKWHADSVGLSVFSIGKWSWRGGCNKIIDKKDTYLEEEKVRLEEREANKNNNCPYYHRKRWKFWA